MSAPLVTAYVGMGANLGQERQTLEAAAAELAATPGVQDLELARFYRTAPVDAGGPDYTNTVARLR
ncbi:MAG: 2-amino-4-hydroxy-6-hydroxymethyldihydropteridine diphosphokinase, partial [Alcaligenes sp.]